MTKSLADQLLNAGLIDKKHADKAKKEKYQQGKQNKVARKKGKPQLDETQLRLQQQKAEQIERDRLLNLKRQEELTAKAMRAQVKQMLQHSKQTVTGDIRFSFTDPRTRKIKQMYVTAMVQEQLARGILAICAEGDNFVVVPRTVADKIAERYQEDVIFVADLQTQKGNQIEDDPYKDFPIPDDLMW